MSGAPPAVSAADVVGTVVADASRQEWGRITAALIALMLFHRAEQAARVNDRGDLVPLEGQDRTRWTRPR